MTPPQIALATGNQPVRVLIVDDDAALRELVRTFLQSHAFEVFEADGGNAMRALLATQAVDVVVLDVMMPGEDGLSMARELAATSRAGVIILSALGQEVDRIIGLEAGADDYLAKPVSPRELLARIRAVLRRRGVEDAPVSGDTYLFAGWTCDLARHLLRDPTGVVVTLSQGEFALLRVFLERPQRGLSRDYLMEVTRGDDSDAFDRAIDSQISRLRRKLASRAGGELIRTIRNEGYQLVPRVDSR